MKRQMTLRSFLVLTCLLLGFGLHAQSRTIHVATPGTLSTYIPSNEKYSITSLTLTGDLNGIDIRFIREMAGRDPYGYITDGKLSVLDLSNANIVAGGDFYFCNTALASYYYSTDNTMGDYVMFDCTRLTSITIPNSVTTIRECAFGSCSGLTSFTISSNVTSIGDYAFSNCSGLKSFTIPGNVTSVGDYAFYYCTGLTSITIPNSVTLIGKGAFYSCSALTEIIVSEENSTFSSIEGVLFSKDKTILVTFPSSKSKSYIVPNSVVSIGDMAFSGCSGLTSLTLTNSVILIGDYAFAGCSGLTLFIIPDSVTSMGDGVFSGCSGLTSLTIPNNVTTIGSYSFRYCTGLTSLAIPNSITSIGKEAFIGCSGLTLFTIPDSVTSISDGAFTGCSGLTSVSIPGNVTSIDHWAFFGCSGLTSVTIPNRVKSIGYQTFASCSGLTTLTIPSNVTSINEYAFSNCKGLTEIHSNNAIPQNINNNVFNGIDKTTCTLYVPKGSLSSYQAAEGWSSFATILEEEITSNPQIQSDNIKVYTEAEAIVMKGVDPGEAISVYSESGVLVQTTQATGSSIRIAVPRGQAYLIKAAGKTFKIAL